MHMTVLGVCLRLGRVRIGFRQQPRRPLTRQAVSELLLPLPQLLNPLGNLLPAVL
jgi:hypothetical protein